MNFIEVNEGISLAIQKCRALKIDKNEETPEIYRLCYKSTRDNGKAHSLYLMLYISDSEQSILLGRKQGEEQCDLVHLSDICYLISIQNEEPEKFLYSTGSQQLDGIIANHIEKENWNTVISDYYKKIKIMKDLKKAQSKAKILNSCAISRQEQSSL